MSETQKKATRWLSVLGAFVLAGCTRYWSDPSQWQPRYATDAALCQRLTSPEPQSEDVFRQCMESRGWPQRPEQR